MTKRRKKARDDLFSASEKEKEIQRRIKERLKKYVDREKKEDDDNKA